MRAILLVVLLAGCGTNDGGAVDQGAGTDGSDDLPAYVPSHDAGPLVCGAAGMCASPNGCCVEPVPDAGYVPGCTTSCPGGVPVACAGPGHCGGLPCCAQLMNSKAQSVTCATHDTDCVPMINFMGNGQTRGCDSDGDCTAGAPDTVLNQCCHLTALGYRICFTSGLVGASKGAITCP